MNVLVKLPSVEGVPVVFVASYHWHSRRRVLIPSGPDCSVVCVDTATGLRVWTVLLGADEGNGPSIAPLAGGAVGGGASKRYVFDSCAQKAQRESVCVCRPMILAMPTSDAILGVDLFSGARVWSLAWHK